MHLVLFIDNLGSGGAQRQLVLLASEFKKRGHDITLLTYNANKSNQFYEPQLYSDSIKHVNLRAKSKLLRPFALREYLNITKPDAVLAFQDVSGLYAELAGLPRRKWRLVVSERTTITNNTKWKRYLKWFHYFSDYLTTNSENNRMEIIKTKPGLKNKTVTIYNGIDYNYFKPTKFPVIDGKIIISVLASHQKNKNLQNVLLAIKINITETLNTKLCIHWYGGVGKDKTPLKVGKKFIDDNKLENVIKLYEPVVDVRKVYQQSHAIMLASFYEGLPNAICEAMACARPVLASNVCENKRLVIENFNGFLFDPNSPESIARTLKKYSILATEEMEKLGWNGYQRALQLFNTQEIVAQYLNLLAGK